MSQLLYLNTLTGTSNNNIIVIDNDEISNGKCLKLH